jgi:hypothetical protein
MRLIFAFSDLCFISIDKGDSSLKRTKGSNDAATRSRAERTPLFRGDKAWRKALR